jgi:putative transposase
LHGFSIYRDAMGPKPRFEEAGAFHHVTSRGNRRATLFQDDRDYLTYLRHLLTAVERCGWRCHAYCLMPNHTHLLIETPEPNLSKGMLIVNGSFARYVNWRHKLDGHVFQGPFCSEHVARDEHLLETCRYIVLNPVRAALCEHPADWRWSSYRAMVGIEPNPPYLTVDFVRDLFRPDGGFAKFCNQVAEQPGCGAA